MPRKYFLTVDTETTTTNRVADFGAVLTDKSGNIHAEIGVLVRDYYLDRKNHPLFHVEGADPLWSATRLDARYAAYNLALQKGTRMLASVNAVNSWLAKVSAKYKPTLTAYNLPFDADKCSKSGILIEAFPQFCLWRAAFQQWGQTKAYRQFCVENHFFNARTKKTGAITMQTSAEIMARFVLKDPALPDEPHTALEDVRNYEVPILNALIKRARVQDYMNAPGVNYLQNQLREVAQAKKGN